MKSLKARVSKLEEARQQRQGLQPSTLTEDGIEARISHGKRGTAPGVTVWYDSLRYDPEEAIATIGPRLPPHGNIFVFPFTLSVAQWEEHYSTTIH